MEELKIELLLDMVLNEFNVPLMGGKKKGNANIKINIAALKGEVHGPRIKIEKGKECIYTIEVNESPKKNDDDCVSVVGREPKSKKDKYMVNMVKAFAKENRDDIIKWSRYHPDDNELRKKIYKAAENFKYKDTLQEALDLINLK